MRQTCPDPCACTMTNVVFDAAGAVIPIITVDCSYRQLENPPEALPPGTTTLRLQGNKVKWYEDFLMFHVLILRRGTLDCAVVTNI